MGYSPAKAYWYLQKQRQRRTVEEPPFDPATLFASGEDGAYYDISDITTLWTDDGVTQVASEDDPVYRVDDKSGNGMHLYQATATKRPLYKAGGGLPYLYFDGVDDLMASVATQVTGPVPVFGAMCASKTTHPSGANIFSVMTGAADYLGFQSVSSSRLYFAHRDNGGTVASIISAVNDAGPSPWVADYYVTDGSHEGWDNVSGAYGPAAGQISGATTLPDQVVGLNAATPTAGALCQLNFYGGVFVDRTMTGADRSGVREWLLGLGGIAA